MQNKSQTEIVIFQCAEDKNPSFFGFGLYELFSCTTGVSWELFSSLLFTLSGEEGGSVLLLSERMEKKLLDILI